MNKKLVSQADVVLASGVSQKTVSRVLGNSQLGDRNVSPALRKLVLDTAARLGYGTGAVVDNSFPTPVTLKNIADRVGVSHTTVGKALHGTGGKHAHISEKVQDMVIKAADEMGYVRPRKFVHDSRFALLLDWFYDSPYTYGEEPHTWLHQGDGQVYTSQQIVDEYRRVNG